MEVWMAEEPGNPMAVSCITTRQGIEGMFSSFELGPCHYHLRDLRRTWNILDFNIASLIFSSLIRSRFDHGK